MVLFAECSKSIAFSESHTLDDDGMSASSVGPTSLVVEALVGKDWSSDTSGDSSPFVWSAGLTDLESVVDEFTSKESACSMVFPGVDGSSSSSSNLTSWESLG